jgi:glutathione synthase/RimK-type ligase-like ATP-grasp enzyme
VPAKLVLVPQKMGSQSAKRLAEVLSAKVGHKVWRCKPESVRGRYAFRLRDGTDKLTQFERFAANGVSCPEFTRDILAARAWANAGHVVVCRTLLRSSEGKGIVVAETADQVVQAPLFTKYVKKKKEFRVHVLNGEVIDIQEKRKRSGNEPSRIRNLANGYVFCRDAIVEPPGLRDLAVAAVAALGYTMGACDIVYNERGNTAYVLEVNACPGMEGTTLENYANKIVELYRREAR